MNSFRLWNGVDDSETDKIDVWCAVQDCATGKAIHQ
jgi:hypothetical protein